MKAHGLSPAPQRQMSWQTFLRAHWGAIAGADFFTSEVWTWRGLVTFYPLGERHFRRAVTEYVAHYHLERNHQGLGNALIEGAPTASGGRVHRQQRLGGLLNYYRRAA